MSSEPKGNKAPSILVVEDEERMRDLLSRIISKAGWRVRTACDGMEGLEELKRARPDVVLTDLNMPRLDGMSLLNQAQKLYSDLPVVVLTAYGSIPGAVDAMRAGAFDFLAKPLPSPDHLRQVLARALQSCGKLSDRRTELERSPIHADPKTVALLGEARTVASRSTTVLITGESGVGKEVIARYLHHHSTRSKGPFVAINCAALPETLQEGELFGYEKGAFTGASKAHPGTFEQADGGTLLFDEVGEMVPALQAKLLRVLETRTVTRLGSTRERSVDVRLLAATNRDLEADVRAGRFREDLFYRLAVFPIQIAALRFRPLDILPLARHFLSLLRAGSPRRSQDFTSEVLVLLQQHRWPGNVRELQNVIERAVILAGADEIRPEHIRFGGQEVRTDSTADDDQPARGDMAAAVGRHGTPDTPPATNLKELEKRAIQDALRATNGNRRAAAKLLGIARRTLHNKLKQLDVD